MFKMTLSGPWEKKLGRFKKTLQDADATMAKINPTMVVREMSKIKGKNVLKVISSHAQAAAKRLVAAQMKNAIVPRGPQAISAWRARAHDIYVQWAKKVIDGVYETVKGGALGQVSMKTVMRKDRERAPLVFGVRGTSPTWADVQKGDAQGSRSHEGELIEVTMRGRKI